MNPPVIRDICGTESGYGKHRRMKEHKCQPCKDAHNVVRKEKYSPALNRKYKKTYTDKVIRPQVEARRKERAARKAAKKAEIEARKEDRRQRGIAYNAMVEARHQAYLEKLANTAKRKADERAALEFRKNEQIRLRAERQQAEKLKREQAAQARLEAKERKLLLNKIDKILKKYIKLKKLEQHGTNTGDYDRCKRINGVACDPCKAVMAAYVRVKSKEPKYKQKEKEWRKANPDKNPTNNRDRARKHGVKTEYYTREHIIKRDGTLCYLCNEEVDFTAPHVQGQPGWETYPHIEHVIPLALGGTDTLDNVKLAHAKCNITKGIRLLPAS